MAVRKACDWCGGVPKWYKEMHKQQKSGLIGTGIRWFACDKHKGSLERTLPSSKHKGIQEYKEETTHA